MLTWLDIPDLPDGERVEFDIVAHREDLFRAALGDELWEWLGEMEGEDGR